MNRESYKFSLTAEIDVDVTDGTSIVEVPVLSYSSLWSKNEIPKASLQAAVGREFGSGDLSGRASFFQTESGLLKVEDGLKVRVYITSELRDSLGTFPRQPLLPEGSGTGQVKFKVYDGYIEGYSFQVDTNGSAVLSLMLEHWLSDLANSAAAHPAMHPSNPASYLFPAVLASTGTGESPSFSEATTLKNFVTLEALTTDLWAGDSGESGIRGYLSRVAEGDLVEDGQIFNDIEEARDFSDGTLVQNALAAFEPLAGDGAYKFGTALKLDTSTSLYLESILEAISAATSLGAESLMALGSQTTWDAILRYAATYLLAVIPMVDRALLVPYFPASRTIFRTIPETQIYSFVKNDSNPNPIKGIGVYGGRKWEASADVAAGPGLDEATLGKAGEYINDKQKRGLLLYVQAPPWLSGPVPSSYTISSGANGGSEATGTAFNPEAGKAPTKPEPAKVMTEMIGLAEKFAQAMYFSEYTKGRSVDISGPLRFDISPGSIVRIYPPKEAFTQDDLFGTPLLGCVESVVIRISVADARPTTSFRISHIRTEAENGGADSIVPERNPVWSSSWVGAPLIEDLPA